MSDMGSEDMEDQGPNLGVRHHISIHVIQSQIRDMYIHVRLYIDI